MIHEETVARSLVEALREAGMGAVATGGGVHWRVDAEPVGSRTLRVHCFWYEGQVSGLVLAMNPANNRTRWRATPGAIEGPEYLMVLRDTGRVADGRTRNAAEVVSCARAWLGGVGLEALVLEVPCVDRKPRAMRAVAARLHSGLRWEILEEPACELWVYGSDRSCCLAQQGERVECSFLIGQAPVARAGAVDDAAGAVGAWLVARDTVRALAAGVRGVELEPHAEVLEQDPARWHWLHVRDRVADPSDALAPMRDLVDALAVSRVAARFFSYSSLNRFCFSASSHYPWVDDGLPVVAPAGAGVYVIGATRCEQPRAVELVEEMLAAAPVQPFFGSAPHHELPQLAECMARHGTALRPQLVQRGAWYRLTVQDAGGTRRCTVSGRHVAFSGPNGRLDATWPELDDLVRSICRFCEENASIDEVASDPRARQVSRSMPDGA